MIQTGTPDVKHLSTSIISRHCISKATAPIEIDD